MDNNELYKPNSHKSKEEVNEERKIKKVINGPVKIKKKSELSKLSAIFISEDASSVKNYVIEDVLIPAAKKAISDIVTNGIDIILYGGTGQARKSNIPGSKVQYSSLYRRNDERPIRQQRASYSYDNIVLTSRGEAEAVLMQLDDIMAQYGLVRVLDLYELVGITGRYTDNNYGWTDIRSAEVVRVRDGYLIKLPRAIPID